MSKLAQYLFFISVFPLALFAQVSTEKVKPPEIPDFAPALQFLASPGLEGRETGTQGATIAADYIASFMQGIGLEPYVRAADSVSRLSDYFQPFRLLRYTTEKAQIVVTYPGNREIQLKLHAYSDFKMNNVYQRLLAESVPVFAGYGINSPGLGYNDYSGLDVKGKIVLVLEGYPGQHDSTSHAWKKFKNAAENDEYDRDTKCLEAAKQGALALITVNKAFLAAKPVNQGRKNVAPVKNEDYADAEYMLPAKSNQSLAPCFRLNKQSSEQLAAALEFDFRQTERDIARQPGFKPTAIKNIVNISTSTFADTIVVNNVIGFLQGKDTSQTAILGAHYDHLGKRGNIVFYGSDDNASGVAGMLALAKVWTESHTIPPCNIVFASWTAEEKGLIGSEYFTGELAKPETVKLYINMDMISRSVSVDTSARMLSIGTRASDEYLRYIARSINSTLDKPFTLDLWDVTGHSGSDYANFMAKNIPVMTYNTGLHDDYHTPRDIPASADLKKMGDVLKVVNSCLNYVLEGANLTPAH